MALNQQQILDLIEAELPDNRKVPISKLREVLAEITENSLSENSLSGGKTYWLGYRWIKGNNKTNPNILEYGDELIGVGNYYPDFVVHLFVKTVIVNDPLIDIAILSSEPL